MNVLVEGLDLMLEQPSWTVKWCGRRRFICGLEDSQDTTSFSVIGLHALL